MSTLKRYTAGPLPMIFAAVVIAAGFIVAACSNASSPVSPGAASGGETLVAPPQLSCPPPSATAVGKVTYCHIAGRQEDENANEIQLNTDVSGYLGHFDIQGNPLAGHEQDKCGPCGATPTPSPAPSPSPSGTP